MFRDLLKADGVPYGTVRLFYRMIQEFGGRAWDGHHREWRTCNGQSLDVTVAGWLL